MKTAVRKMDPEEFILSVLTPKERFEASMRLAREAFRNRALTIEDVEAAVRKVRRRHYAARQKKAAGLR